MIAESSEGGDSGHGGGQDSGQQDSGLQESEQDEVPQQDEEQEDEEQEQPEPVGSGESTTVTMPALGESVTEGTVTRWLKQVGDPVEVDEPLLEVSTDKVDTEVPSPVAGTLLEISIDEDATVEIGGRIAVIGTTGSAPSQAEAKPRHAAEDDRDDAGQAAQQAQPDPEP